jgi:LacI family transcriptional regulator
MSVSVALRGKPGVSEALRAKILKRARELGYRPNPVAAELMSLVRSRSRSRGTETIAFLNTFADADLFFRIPGLGDFVTGARARAQEYGYGVEVFHARKEGVTGKRLAGILRARGVRGILVGPRWRTEPDIDFSWDDFSVVLVGEAEYGPNLYRVCNHHVHSCFTVLQALAAKGYGRIGLALVREDESKRGYDYLLGVEQFRLSGGRAEVVSWLYQEFSSKEFVAWTKRERLDAVVSLAVDPGLESAKLKGPEGKAMGYANLNVVAGMHWAGIDQNSLEIGGAAVDLLRGLLLEGERGVVPRPRIVLVEGKWVDAVTG